MICRFGGGNNGIAEYLENGRKSDREFTRDELDSRLVLSGDLALANSVIQSITDKGQERYLHITLSFHEAEISKDVLSDIVDEYKSYFMTAYHENEYSFYAEAHLPKIKTVIDNRTGELVDRKPHIHIVIPRTNLVTGKSMNPRGDLTNLKTQISLDAIQEHINNKYNLVSPKDCVRVSDNNYANVLSRAKGDLFRERQSDLKRNISSEVENRGVCSMSEFSALLETFGDVKERNAGTKDSYFAVKFAGDEKFTNLKNPMFSREYIEKRDISLKKPTETQIKNRLETWVNQRSLEIKYIYPSGVKHRNAYKDIPESEKQIYLRNVDNDYREKFQLSQERGRAGDRQRGIKFATNAINSKRAFGMPRMPERGVVYGLRGFERSPSERVLSNNEQRDLAKYGVKNEDIRSSMRWNEYSAERGIKTIADSSVAHELIFSHFNEMAQKNERELFKEIREKIDPERFMEAVKQQFNVDKTQHKITKAKDGSMRVRAGERNLNASDFLTKYVNLSWQEAKVFLLKIYSEQQQGKPYKHEEMGISSLVAKERFDSLNQSKRYLSQMLGADRQALYKRVRDLRSELKNTPKGDRDIANGFIAYVKITGMEIIDEKLSEARNFISQYHSNWNEDKNGMKALDKIISIVGGDDSDNGISSGKENVLGLKEAIQKQQQAQNYAKLKDLVMVRSESKIEYKDPESQKAIFIDNGSRLVAKTDDKTAIAIMLEYAKEKYGGELKLNGSESFKQLCAEVAAEKGMTVILKPDEYHQIMQDRKAELAASIEATEKSAVKEPLEAKEIIPTQQTEQDVSLVELVSAQELPDEKELPDELYVREVAPDVLHPREQEAIDLLNKFEKLHADYNLYFNKDAEEDRISGMLSVMCLDEVREHMEFSLNERIQRASSSQSGQEME